MDQQLLHLAEQGSVLDIRDAPQVSRMSSSSSCVRS
jgi:hypothetical protein